MQSILLIKLFLLFLLNNAVLAEDSAEVVYEKPVELVPDKIVTVEYNIHDHCMPIPDHKWRHFHQLAFRLFPHEFCGGDEDQGYLICFPGQLGVESPHLLKGQISSMQHRVPNLKNNKVAKRCAELLEEIAKENKCSDELDSQTCSELTRKVGRLHKQNVARGSWHGMLVRTDSNGSFVVQISTSNENFTIPREKIHEWLVLKLASPKHGGSSFFSSNIGPLRDVGASNDRKEFMERAGYIPLDADKKLHDGYHAKQHMGFPLRKSVGIWSLGLDLLPLEGLDRIFLASERSECCSDMDVWFMLPTARMMEQPGKEPKPLELPFMSPETPLAVGSKISFRGSVNPDAEWIEITITNILVPITNTASAMKNEKLKELKYIINFNNNQVRFEQMTASGDNLEPNTASSPFKKGEQFLLSFILEADHIRIEENCRVWNVSLGGELIHEDLYPLKVDGNTTLYRYDSIFNQSFHLIHSWFMPLSAGDKEGVSSGILIRGRITASGKEVIICLWKRESEPYTYTCVFCFRLRLNDLKYHLYFEHHHVEDMVQMDVEERNIVGKAIEVFIRWNNIDKKSEFWVNDKKIPFQKVPHSILKKGIYFLQVTGDIEDIKTVGKMPNLHPLITPATRYKFPADLVRFMTGEFVLKCKILESFHYSLITLSHDNERLGHKLMQLYIRVNDNDNDMLTIFDGLTLMDLFEWDKSDLQHDFVLKFRYLVAEYKMEITINGQSAILDREVEAIPPKMAVMVDGDILIIPSGDEEEESAIQ